MRIIFDTNVILDVLANRMPFADDSVRATSLAVEGKVEGAISSNTVTDIAYQLNRVHPPSAVKMLLLDILTCLQVIDVNHSDCIHACNSKVADYEDALLVASAKRWKADLIVTRDKKDFTNSDIPAISPTAFLKKF